MTNKKMMHEARVMHARQEADSRLRRALEKKVREHKMEKAIQENKGNYMRDKPKVIGIVGKTVVVKHGGTLREVSNERRGRKW